MESNKEKTRQVLAMMYKYNSKFAMTVETAASKEDENCGINPANTETETETETESAASMNPVICIGPQSIQALLAIKGYSNINENVDFSTICDYVSGDAFFTNVMRDRYFFMWMTARDDKVRKKYCKPLDGVIWTQRNQYNTSPRSVNSSLL